MFGKSGKSASDDAVVMKIVADGKVRDVTVKELVLSQNLSMEALTSVLIRKGILTAEDLLDEIQRIRETHT